MRTLLPGLGTAALGVAVLLTLALALTTKLFTLRPPSGPDAMGLVVVFFLPIGAWLLVLFGALVCVARGGFDWVSRSPGIPTLAVLGTVVGLGILSVGAAVFSLEVRYASRTVAGLAGGLLLPLLVIGVLGFLLWSDPGSVSGAGWLRPAGAILAALAVFAFAGGFVLFLKDSAEDARRAEEGRVADEARQAECGPRTPGASRPRPPSSRRSPTTPRSRRSSRTSSSTRARSTTGRPSSASGRSLG
ncbi:MAG: hypothetical protein IPF66_10020 [Holophagales bacterium]|nr:hypothetical protein [Holophagales bacterium]